MTQIMEAQSRGLGDMVTARAPTGLPEEKKEAAGGETKAEK